MTVLFPRTESKTATITPWSTVGEFWTEFNSCIYLFKLRNTERAEPLCGQLSVVSSEVIGDPTPSILTKIIVTLSPINFGVHLSIRQRLLEHFLELAEERWDEDHLATVIVRELQRDNKFRQVTEKALSYVWDSVIDQACCVNHPPSAVELEAQTSIIALLRRDNAIDAAGKEAGDLLAHSESHFGRESAEFREAAKELAHVWLDTLELDEAQELSKQRVGRFVSRDGVIGHSFRDSRAMRALEDLAEIERKRRLWRNVCPG